MRVLNLNKAVGYASSGVEYAQKYRRELLAGLPDVEDLYVFSDYIGTNLTVFTDRLGFDRDQVLWIYHLLSGRRATGCTLTVDDVVKRFGGTPARHSARSRGIPSGQAHDDPQRVGDWTEVALKDSPVRYRIRTVDGGFVDAVETVIGDRLLRVERYDDSLSNVEHFHENRLVRRVFYTRSGEVAAEQLYRDGHITRTVITPASPLHAPPPGAGPVKGRTPGFGGNLVLDGRSRFFQHVFAHLFQPDDVVIVDRALDVVDAVYPVIGDRRLYSVVHAEHFDRHQVDDGVLLWNNHYEYVFTRPDLIDGLIVSTRRQQEALENHLAVEARARAARASREAAVAPPSSPIPVIRIPVGTATVREERHHDPNALVTASRLADEKHLDLLVRAVAHARKTLPDLRLDIFGEGNREPLLAAVKEAGAQEYVRLRGHQKLDGVLGGYALYVSASTSEGFGLSLLEAISEGLPVVGFDVDYGNREMVQPGINGTLVPHTGTDTDVTALADAVVGLLTTADLGAMRAASRAKAAQYAPERVRERWAALLRGGAPC